MVIDAEKNQYQQLPDVQEGAHVNTLLYVEDNMANMERVASMLGVTEAAGRLQDAGYIRYRRGHIGVLDRKASV